MSLGRGQNSRKRGPKSLSVSGLKLPLIVSASSVLSTAVYPKKGLLPLKDSAPNTYIWTVSSDVPVSLGKQKPILINFLFIVSCEIDNRLSALCMPCCLEMQVVKLIKAYVLSAPDPRPRGIWKPMSPLDKSDYNNNYHYLHRFTKSL